MIHPAGMRRRCAGIGTVTRRLDLLLVIDEVVDQATLTGLSCLQRDVEAQPAICITGSPACLPAAAKPTPARAISVSF